MSDFYTSISESCPDLSFKTLYCDNCGDFIVVPITCKKRSCEVCSKINARRVRSRYLKLFTAFENADINNFVLITLTSLPLDARYFKAGYQHLKRQLRKLLRRKIWIDNIEGGFYCFETTCRSDNSFHLHIHILARTRTKVYHYRDNRGNNLCSVSTLTRDRLSSLWFGYTRAYITDIRPVYNSLSSAVYYILKYLGKVPKFYTEDQREFYDLAFFNTRRLSFFGDWYSALFTSEKKSFCSACGKGTYCISGEFIDFISDTSLPKLRKLGLHLDSYG